MALEHHLARHRLADLFLDTLPYDAHTTARDSPVLGSTLITCLGKTFRRSVAASVLEAVGLPELVTGNLEEYEALALRLAREPLVLQGLRERLARNRGQCNSLDSHRYRQHLESATLPCGSFDRTARFRSSLLRQSIGTETFLQRNCADGLPDQSRWFLLKSDFVELFGKPGGYFSDAAARCHRERIPQWTVSAAVHRW